jgi:enoyl-CoA hydratase/carnithine racemase
MTFQQIIYQVDGPVATITFNRPGQMNALTKVLEAELRTAVETAGRDPAVRAIVLTGAGRAFCAGMDMEELAVLPPEDIQAEEWMRPYDMNRRADYQTRYTYFPATHKPIISAVNGAAAGLGLIMALYSDFRIASDKAVFATAFAKRGLIAEHGIAWILPRIVGHTNATDLLLTSRKIDAAEALAMGLVNRVVAADELLPQALALAATTIAGDPQQYSSCPRRSGHAASRASSHAAVKAVSARRAVVAPAPARSGICGSIASASAPRRPAGRCRSALRAAPDQRHRPLDAALGRSSSSDLTGAKPVPPTTHSMGAVDSSCSSKLPKGSSTCSVSPAFSCGTTCVNCRRARGGCAVAACRSRAAGWPSSTSAAAVGQRTCRYCPALNLARWPAGRRSCSTLTSGPPACCGTPWP